MTLSFFGNLFDLFKASSSSLKSTFIIIPILCIAVIVIGISIKKRDSVKHPSTIGVFAEGLVGWVNDQCEDLMGRHGKKFAPWIITFAIFIFVANISGLFGLTPPTANVFITVGLGLISGFLIHFAGISISGWKKYIKGTYLDPSPVMAPLNLFSEFLTPFSLGLRLFGNILSGCVITGLIYNLILGTLGAIFPALGVLVAGIIMPAFHAIFDIFFGFIQTYVFILLTMVFISGKIDED